MNCFHRLKRERHPAYITVLLILPLILCSFIAAAQNTRGAALDAEIKEKTRELVNQNRIEDAMHLNEKYVAQSVSLQYLKGQAKGNINIGNLYGWMGKYKEGLVYLNKARDISALMNDPEIDARLNAEYGVLYSNLTLSSASGFYFNKAIAAAQNITNKAVANKALWYCYASRAGSWDAERADSMYADLKKAFDIDPDPNTGSRIAKYFIENKPDYNAAALYLHNADSLYRAGSYPSYYQSIIWLNYGKLYFKQKEYAKAISFLKNAEPGFWQHGKPGLVKPVYSLLYQAYKQVGNDSGYRHYLEAYTLLSDSIAKSQPANIAKGVENLQQEAAATLKSTRSFLYWIILAVILLAGLVWWATFRFLTGKKKEKEKQLKQKDAEVDILQQKVNESFEALLVMAREADPHFYARFREVYPGFQDALTAICPTLKQSELELGAYIYLGFSSKEIAEFTFKSLRTIDNRRYGLRKRLGIGTNEDMHVWLKNSAGWDAPVS